MTNKKSLKRALILNVLSTLLCVSMLLGTTFAWFTDTVESGVNQIVAGNLDVELYHTNSTVTTAETVQGATNLFQIAKWEPGAVVYENFLVKNLGDLALKYKLSLNIADFNSVTDTTGTYDLRSALKVAIVPGGFTGTRDNAAALTGYTNLADFEENGILLANGASDTYGVVIYWQPTENDNNYNVNNAKVVNQSGGGVTANQANNRLFIKFGVNLIASQYTYEEDSFDDQYDAQAHMHRYSIQSDGAWTCSTSNCDIPTYPNTGAAYAMLSDGITPTTATALTSDGNYTVGNATVTVSGDSITYTNTGAAQTVIIRTDSANTTLTIDDASTGTIYHYGSAGALNIIQCHTASYHEKGNVAFAEIATGRIVLESGSEIKHIHVNANENANGFEEVIIADNGAKALPEAITRDQVDVTEAKPVVTVESGSSSETVYVYPYTDSENTKTGTTEQTTNQNTAIATDLGILVLDNGSDAGEKAMSNNEKTSAKQEVVEVAQNEEEIEKAENSGYDITHHEALAPTCTEDGHTAYDSYYVNNEEQKVGYKVIPATGHHKSDNPSYQHAFSAAHWQHATQCVVDSAWIVEDCVDLNNDNYCDICNQQMYVLVYTSSDLHTNSKYPSAIWNGAYKLMNNVSLDTMSRIYGDVVIDLNGYTLSNYSINSPADTQFMSYSNANAIYTLTLRDSSISKTGMFMSRFGDTFFDGSGNSGNNRFILYCEDGVTINTSFNYQGTEMDSFAYTGGYFINNASKDIIIRNAHLVIGGIANVNSGYTITFENCVIESRQSSGFLQSGSGNIVFDGCTITTVMQSSSGNVLDSSDPNVTFINGTTVNGVTK